MYYKHSKFIDTLSNLILPYSSKENRVSSVPWGQIYNHLGINTEWKYILICFPYS